MVVFAPVGNSKGRKVQMQLVLTSVFMVELFYVQSHLILKNSSRHGGRGMGVVCISQTYSLSFPLFFLICFYLEHLEYMVAATNYDYCSLTYLIACSPVPRGFLRKSVLDSNI